MQHVYRHIFVSLALIMTVVLIHATAKPNSTSKNHGLLTKLGMHKIRGPTSHHKKRLAVESRHHSRSDDSHMFIIKLPPNPHYYVHNRPNTIQDDHHVKSKKLPMGFKNNGKPAKIYHWNLPVLKKMASKYKKSSNHKIDLSFPENFNEVFEKPMKEKKPVRPSYYVPAKAKKTNFMKYFPGNGKPHSFYVIEGRKAHYHRLLP